MGLFLSVEGETLHGTGSSDSVAAHGNVIFIKE